MVLPSRKDATMHANVGDHIVIRNHRIGQPDQDGQVIEVRGKNGEPPYVVRWVSGHETLFFPGPDALVEHLDQP
jgi:Domain of unknown function (DUF1918)